MIEPAGISNARTGPALPCVRSAPSQAQAPADPADSFQQSPEDDGIPSARSLGSAGVTQGRQSIEMIKELVLEKGARPAYELKEEWSYNARSGVSPHPNVGPGGHVNVSTFGQFTVVRDGAKVAEFEMKDPTQKHYGLQTLAVNREPAFTEEGVAFVPDRSGKLHAFDCAKQQKLWEFTTRAKAGVTAPVLGEGNRIFMRDGNGNLYAIDPSTGKEIWSNTKWSLAFKEEPNTVPPPENHPPALGPDGTLYVIGKKGILYAIDGANGKMKSGFNGFEAGDSVNWGFSPICDGKGRVYVPSRDRESGRWNINCIDGATGEKIWGVSTGLGQSAPVIGPDGTVYIGTKGPAWIRKDNYSENHKVLALDPKTGKELWQHPIEGPVESLALDPSGKRLAVLHNRTLFHDAIEEIEQVDNITLIDLTTRAAKYSVKPGTSERDGVHSISFAPDGKLIAYGYPDMIRAYTINDENLFVGKDGGIITGDDLATLAAGAGAPGKTGSGIVVEEIAIRVDGVRLRKKG
jgi:outer membrane protein assembly factor BamB